MADGQFIVGDGSGGGGSYSIGGAGGDGADTLTGTSYNDVIFGDGSGGGGGASGSGSNTGGLGGGGADTLYGGDGNDILFGDGFNGEASGATAGGAGGLGGGGGGGGYGFYAEASAGGAGGLGAGDGGAGGMPGQDSDPASKDGVGSYFSLSGTYLPTGLGGGGGGFGDSGDGPVPGMPGYAGGTSVYAMTDSGGTLYNSVLSEVTAGNIYNSTAGTTNGYGAGNDLLDGGAGSDHYFGMGGADTFVVSEQDNAGTDGDTVWDFSRTDGDKIKLEDASGNVIDAAGIDTLLAAADTSSGDTVITMSDGSTVTIKGVTDLTSADFETACFLPRTQFETSEGMKAIEELQIGDMMKTADGYAPLKWLAQRQVNWSMSIARRVAPVLVKQGALGDGLPLRDLYVSPAHALLVDGVLVNAELLVNGTTIVQLLDYGCDFTYFNIELDIHAIVYAEGAPVESYLEVGDNRRSYDNASEFHALYPDHRPTKAMDLPRATLKRHRPAPRQAA